MTESCKYLTLKGLQIMTFKLDEMRLLNYIMGWRVYTAASHQGFFFYFYFYFYIFVFICFLTHTAVCWDFSSCIPFLFELCEMDIQINLALNIK